MYTYIYIAIFVLNHCGIRAVEGRAAGGGDLEHLTRVSTEMNFKLDLYLIKWIRPIYVKKGKNTMYLRFMQSRLTVLIIDGFKVDAPVPNFFFLLLRTVFTQFHFSPTVDVSVSPPSAFMAPLLCMNINLYLWWIQG